VHPCVVKCPGSRSTSTPGNDSTTQHNRVSATHSSIDRDLSTPSPNHIPNQSFHGCAALTAASLEFCFFASYSDLRLAHDTAVLVEVKGHTKQANHYPSYTHDRRLALGCLPEKITLPRWCSRLQDASEWSCGSCRLQYVKSLAHAENVV
jgi:hypothetical protein